MSERTSKLLGRARAVYREWHQKHPKKTVEASYDFPEKVHVLGKAKNIIYASDKWENEVYTYTHDFDSHPEVYGPLKPRSNPGETKSTKRLLGVRSFDQQLPLPILATVLELTYDSGSREERTVFGHRQPLLCSTLDKRTLVILDFPHVILINGGEMRVTERGIVK